eukprot:TRINITY_DN909_c0_g1_i13.p3 TRINITY_DN909_c0_g1~~TRINITY_DN909_c0_g1_i13.p3  ORF type:complete len:326 (-),score=33.55 TRINITY_DN909_c0_g1_i13:1665-2585(-)
MLAYALAPTSPRRLCSLSYNYKRVSRQREKLCKVQAIACIGDMQSCGRQIKLSFQLPYRCQFGQQLCIVGNTESLGLWDVRKGLSMEWSTGDVWKVDVELEAQGKISLEYKYVVKNKDGSPATWKPGDNFQLDVPQSNFDVEREWLKISDAWDGVQQVELEEPKANNLQPQVNNNGWLSNGISTNKTENGHTEDVSKLQPLSTAFISQEEPIPAPPAKPTPSEHNQKKSPASLSAMEETVNRAFDDLDQAINRSLDLIESTGETANSEAIQCDRIVATLAQRAITLQKALATSKPPPTFLFEGKAK